MTEEEHAEIWEMLESWYRQYKGDLPPESTPYKIPPDRFGHLNPKLRMFLARMDEDDVEQFSQALEFYRTARLGGRILMWIGIVLGAAIGGIATLGDHVVNMLRGFK